MTACTAPPSATATPEFKNLQTRIAATLAAIPTAKSLTPPAPTASATSAAPAATATPAPTVSSTSANINANVAAPQDYVVQSGDTLSTIAVKFNTSIAAIQLLNNLNDARVVQQGRTLKIPAAKLAPDENPYWIVHIVEAGETLSTIAVRYAVRLDDLLRVNAITDSSLTRAGDRLVIPVRGPVQ